MPSMPVDDGFIIALTVYGIAAISMPAGSVCDQVKIGETLDIHRNSTSCTPTKIESVRVLSKQREDDRNNLAVVVRVGS